MTSRLDTFNAVPGSPRSVLHGGLAELPRLVFTYSRKNGFTAIPTPMRFPPGPRALAAFGAWADLAGRYELVPGPDPRTNGNLEARVYIDGVEVRVWVPIHGLTIQEAIDLVDATRKRAARG